MNFNFLLVLAFSVCSIKASSIDAKRASFLLGVKDNGTKKSHWNNIYLKSKSVYGTRPVQFLADNASYFTPDSKVLDIGVGEGRNAIYLAKQGVRVTGIDISNIGIEKTKEFAKKEGVNIRTILADVNKYDFKPHSFDGIICFYYVNRDLIKKMKSWVKPGGYIIFEAYSINQRQLQLPHERDSVASYLKPQELLDLFFGTKIVKFEESQSKTQYTSSIIVKAQ